nr:immunoglobulin light chain junction region [Macaca mulatta]MPO00752.1 immunoglobulin light chain junction region [Macaca mulatta]
CQYGYGIPFTF